MQHYQRASQAIREGEERPLNLLKNVGLSAAGGGAANLGSKAMARMVPAVGALISKYVPDNILTAGLSKLDPRLGTFMQGALDAGYTHDDIREFMGDKIEKSQDKTVQKDKKNIVEQYSPELHQYIVEETKKGRPLLQVGALAQLGGKKGSFKKIIEKIEKDHKTPWSSILESVYGGAQNTSQSQSPSTQPSQQTQMGPKQKSFIEKLDKLDQRFA